MNLSTIDDYTILLRPSCYATHSVHAVIRPRLLRGCGELQEAFSGSDVGILVCLGLGREGSIGGPEIDQRLHGLQLGGLEHIQGGSSQDEMGEATVELLLQVEVVEGLGEVSPVKVSVDSEHLSENHLADVDKLVGETRSLADILGLTGAREL